MKNNKKYLCDSLYATLDVGFKAKHLTEPVSMYSHRLMASQIGGETKARAAFVVGGS